MPTHTAGALYRLLVSHARGVEKMVPPPVRRVCLYYYILPKHFINRPGQLLRKPLYGKRATLSRRKKYPLARVNYICVSPTERRGPSVSPVIFAATRPVIRVIRVMISFSQANRNSTKAKFWLKGPKKVACVRFSLLGTPLV